MSFELLRGPYSLSVDQLSVDPTTCWNLAPIGQRGVQVTLGLCRALQNATGNGARLILKGGGGKG